MIPVAAALSNSNSTARRPSTPRSIRVLVHVQIDVFVHDVLAHLLGVLAHVLETRGAMRECVLDAAAQDAVHAVLDIRRAASA